MKTHIALIKFLFELCEKIKKGIKETVSPNKIKFSVISDVRSDLCNNNSLDHQYGSKSFDRKWQAKYHLFFGVFPAILRYIQIKYKLTNFKKKSSIIGCLSDLKDLVKLFKEKHELIKEISTNDMNRYYVEQVIWEIDEQLS